MRRAEQRLIEPIVDAGGDARWQPRPTLLSLAEPFYACFMECSADRHWDGMSGTAGPIPRLAVTDWLDENGIADPAERREHRYFVTRLDARWRVLDRRRVARAQNATPGAKPAPIEMDDPDDDGSL